MFIHVPSPSWENTNRRVQVASLKVLTKFLNKKVVAVHEIKRWQGFILWNSAKERSDLVDTHDCVEDESCAGGQKLLYGGDDKVPRSSLVARGRIYCKDTGDKVAQSILVAKSQICCTKMMRGFRDRALSQERYTTVMRFHDRGKSWKRMEEEWKKKICQELMNAVDIVLTLGLPARFER